MLPPSASGYGNAYGAKLITASKEGGMEEASIADAMIARVKVSRSISLLIQITRWPTALPGQKYGSKPAVK